MNDRSMTMRMLIVAIALAHCLLFPPFLEPAKANEADLASIDLAGNAGLKWLVERQREDGSFGKHATVGVTSVAGLAFLTTDETNVEYSAALRRALQFVLSQQAESGIFGNMMYEHVFAVRFVAEARLASGDEPERERLKLAIERAVAVMKAAQTLQGGWRYSFKPLDEDTSVTSCALIALHTALRADIAVEAEMIERANAYLRRCQNADGGFRYMSSGGGSARARTAAALTALTFTGAEWPEIAASIRYLASTAPAPGSAEADNEHDCGHYHYLHYFQSHSALRIESLRELHRSASAISSSDSTKMATGRAN